MSSNILILEKKKRKKEIKFFAIILKHRDLRNIFIICIEQFGS